MGDTVRQRNTFKERDGSNLFKLGRFRNKCMEYIVNGIYSYGRWRSTYQECENAGALGVRMGDREAGAWNAGASAAAHTGEALMYGMRQQGRLSSLRGASAIIKRFTSTFVHKMDQKVVQGNWEN